MPVVIAELDGREVARYEINHAGWDGPDGRIPANEADLYVEARQNLIEDGYPQAVALKAILRLERSPS